MTAVFKPSNTAVITGGASGIGLALAKRCLSNSMKVLVADCDDDLLSLLQSQHSSIIPFKMDVGNPSDWERLKAKVDEVFTGKINLLALNAGVGTPSSWSDPYSFTKILNTNLYGVINGITTLLPAVKAAAAASSTAIVITGSKQGITNPPGNPAYNASKAAVKTLAEHLDWDLRGEANISVHLLVPGWTFTGLSGGRPTAGGSEREKKQAGAWWPEQVVDYLQTKMDEAKFYIICPDNDVSEETDKRRMLWSVGDVVEGRPPLTRWRDEWKGKAQEWMDKQDV
ncbi:hypothetical protein B0T16DRAFT_403329 [Cercophora newfieldiana]|uniref:Uncharacterized protein n=1 Tax=Cercophora newfieldiana TaxID=92897 RepID=A0AA40CVY9_9PEZI|nr:hypothetical protein B0T16DRAFT_403329 [Cercophora newfieldiana]